MTGRLHALRSAPEGGIARMPSFAQIGAMFGAFLAGSLAMLATWRERSRARAELASLDDRTLQDIGLVRFDQTCTEVDRPIFRP